MGVWDGEAECMPSLLKREGEGWDMEKCYICSTVAEEESGRVLKPCRFCRNFGLGR